MYSAVVVQEVLKRRQEPWRWGVQWLAIRSWQWPTGRIIKADPATTTQEVPQELDIDRLWLFNIWNKLERWKSLVPHELIAKKLSFWRVIFSNSLQQQWTISQSDCDIQWKVDFIGQPATTSSVAEMRRSSKAKLALKKGHGHCLEVCCWSDPL